MGITCNSRGDEFVSGKIPNLVTASLLIEFRATVRRLAVANVVPRCPVLVAQPLMVRRRL